MICLPTYCHLSNNQVNEIFIIYSVLQGNLCDVSKIRSEPARQYRNNWAISVHFQMHSLPQSQAEMYQVGKSNLTRGLRSPNVVGSMKGLTFYCKLTHCPHQVKTQQLIHECNLA